MFCRVTCLITVFITVERCLCFVIPLRVKSLLTPTRSAIIVMAIFILMLLTLALPYSALRLDWRWDPIRNRSMIGTVHAIQDSAKLMQARIKINLTLQVVSLLALVVSNIALAISVHKQVKWRARTTAIASHQNQTAMHRRSSEPTTYRNKRLARMIQFLSLVLFVTYGISTLLYVISVVLPEFGFYGQYNNEFRSSWMVAITAQALNSSVNILFYYRMNTRFRNTFNKMFRKKAARVGIFSADHNTLDNTPVVHPQRSTQRY
ncbi:chemosensory receptor B [Elysia marginata]|uniref:Chemosensory receptor B n=1 Tax=Elysia marginata TaxID=1093978 RepID=A0AAV4ETR2_9GAST|nr:chemosensory receptor B [Elysia marginata]